MKNYMGGVALAGLALFATPAAAAQMLVTVNGVLTGSLGEIGFLNTGVDAHLATGSTFTLTASFDSSLLIPWGSNGYSVVGLYGLSTTGASYYRVDAPGMTWQTTDNLLDFQPIYSYDYEVSGQPAVHSKEGGPAIIIQGNKVIGLSGDLSSGSSSARPELTLGSTTGSGFDTYFNLNPGDPVQHFSNFTAASTTDAFRIDAPNGLYGNTYNTPGFIGTWDFADSVVTTVPEPATWTLFLLGFGGIGFVMRRRKSVSSSEELG